MSPEPFNEFRYSCCGTSSHGLQPIVMCLWLPLSFDLELQLCLASGAVGVISLGTAVVTLKFLFWYKPCGIVWTLQEPENSTIQEPENSTILPGPSAVLNDDDEGGLSVASWGLLFSKPFPWFRVKMLTHFEDFLEL